jgi:adenine C2-methylase RlmN of 23S rRNA A2503 and tRNA A37
MPARYDATREDLAALLADEKPFRVKQVWEGLHTRLAAPSEMTELPAALRDR